MPILTKASSRSKATSRPSASNLIFSRGWVGRRDLVWILAHDDPDTGTRTRILQFKAGQWVQRIVGWGGIAVTAVMKPEVEVIVLGAEGEVLVGQRTGFADEHVDPSIRGPEINGLIRDARFIGAQVMAVGMSRQVYQRTGPALWVHVDQGVLATPRDLVGLNAIDGFEPKDVYTVGVKGEIWHYNGRTWTRDDSPTNVALNRVRCITPHTVYACGAAGTLIRGTEGRFEVIEHDTTSDNLYGLEWYDGKLYVAGLKSLYVLEGDELRTVDLALGPDLTFGDLHANDGVLWSFGARHLVYTEDGSTWTQVFYS